MDTLKNLNSITNINLKKNFDKKHKAGKSNILKVHFFYKHKLHIKNEQFFYIIFGTYLAEYHEASERSVRYTNYHKSVFLEEEIRRLLVLTHPKNCFGLLLPRFFLHPSSIYGIFYHS